MGSESKTEIANELTELIKTRHRGIVDAWLNKDETHYNIAVKSSKTASSVLIDLLRAGMRGGKITPPSPFSKTYLVSAGLPQA